MPGDNTTINVDLIAPVVMEKNLGLLSVRVIGSLAPVLSVKF